MRLRSLTRLLEAVFALVHPEDVTVLGSSALLACDPSLGESGQPLELSLDADLLVQPCDERQAGVLHEAIGEGSLYHQNYGVYADIMRPDVEETFPEGWRSRRISMPDMPRASCLDAHDVAAAKLVLGRPKDMTLLRALLARGTLDIETLRGRYGEMRLSERDMFAAGRNLRRLELVPGRQGMEKPADPSGEPAGWRHEPHQVGEQG